MERRRVSVSKLNGRDIASVLRGEVIEVTYQERVDAVLIRRPQNEDEVKLIADQLSELILTYIPSPTKRGRPQEKQL